MMSRTQISVSDVTNSNMFERFMSRRTQAGLTKGTGLCSSCVLHTIWIFSACAGKQGRCDGKQVKRTAYSIYHARAEHETALTAHMPVFVVLYSILMPHPSHVHDMASSSLPTCTTHETPRQTTADSRLDANADSSARRSY